MVFSLFKKKDKPATSVITTAVADPPKPAAKTSSTTSAHPKHSGFKSKRGLIVGEVLLLDYVKQGKMPKEDGNYQKFWSDKYGIEDVEGALRDLESQGFIEFDQNWKYRLTELGRTELEENGYVPYMHKCKQEISPQFDVWSINHRLNGDTSDWRRVTYEEHLKEVNRMIEINRKMIEHSDPRNMESWNDWPKDAQERMLENFERNRSELEAKSSKNIETFSSLADELKAKIKELDQ